MECEFCKKVLIGEGVNLDYISIKGSVCLNRWLDDRYGHLYATRSEGEFHEFCSYECLVKWSEESINDVKKRLSSAYNRNNNPDNFDYEGAKPSKYGLRKSDLE